MAAAYICRSSYPAVVVQPTEQQIVTSSKNVLIDFEDGEEGEGVSPSNNNDDNKGDLTLTKEELIDVGRERSCPTLSICSS